MQIPLSALLVCIRWGVNLKPHILLYTKCSSLSGPGLSQGPVSFWKFEILAVASVARDSPRPLNFWGCCQHMNSGRRAVIQGSIHWSRPHKCVKMASLMYLVLFTVFNFALRCMVWMSSKSFTIMSGQRRTFYIKRTTRLFRYLSK